MQPRGAIVPDYKTLTTAKLEQMLQRHQRFILSQRDGTRASLKFHDLPNARLAGQNLAGADLTGARLRGADLHGAILDNACLFGADLAGANLAEASMCNIDLRGCALRGATMTRAVLIDADLRDGYLVRYQNGDFSAVAADKLHAELSEAKIKGASLSRAKLSNAFILQTEGLLDQRQEGKAGGIGGAESGEHGPKIHPARLFREVSTQFGDFGLGRQMR